MRRLALIGLAAALTAIACKSGSNAKSSGPVIAKGDGFTITADEFKARLDEQSPFIRQRYTTLERKKEFLDNLVRFEVLAHEAEKRGLRDDPDVQNTLKRIMVQKLVQRNFQQDASAAAAVPDADVQKYFEEHKADYFRAKRVRASVIALVAPAGSPDRVKKLAAAKKALATLKADEAKNPLAFSKLVSEVSEDQATKASAGDLGFKSQDELEKATSKELAAALFGMKQGETSGVLELPQGLYIAKVTAVQEEMNRSLEQVKGQIAQRLGREKKTKEFDEFVKKLKEDAKLTVDDKALEAIEVSTAPGPAGTGMPPGHPSAAGLLPPGAMPASGSPTVTPLKVTPAPSATPAPK